MTRDASLAPDDSGSGCAEEIPSRWIKSDASQVPVAATAVSTLLPFEIGLGLLPRYSSELKFTGKFVCIMMLTCL